MQGRGWGRRARGGPPGVVLGPAVCPGRPHTCASRHPHLGLGRGRQSCRFWHLAGVCSLVGLGHRGTPTSALHTKSGLRPGAWSEGPEGPRLTVQALNPGGSQMRRGAARRQDPPARPCSAWAGWPLGSLQVVQASSTPLAPGALGPSGAAAQAGPWLRAEASLWGRGPGSARGWGDGRAPGQTECRWARGRAGGRGWGVTTLFASHPGLLCSLGEAACLPLPSLQGP